MLEWRQVKTVVVCQSVSSSSQTENFRKKLESLDILCWLSSPLAEATEGGLKCFVNVKVNVSGLEDSCLSSTTMKEVGFLLDCCCCPVLGHLALLSRLDELI